MFIFWIVLTACLASLCFNVYLLRKIRKPRIEVQDNLELYSAIDQIGKSGSALPDLSLNLTSLAANNLKSVDSFRDSTKDLQNILEGSVSNFQRIDELGKQNILSIEQRIGELKGFIKSIDELNEQNKSVADAVLVLEDIASQTSILALNASVEAARAGSHGTGFAVIAKSVRDLATKSLSASESIKKVTTQSKEHGAHIASGVLDSSNALQGIFEDINQIIGSLKEGLQSFEENSMVVDRIVNSANILDATVQRNLHAVRESSQIGIKLGIHLDDLYVGSNYKNLETKSNHEFIKPEHVFHFNFTNTLPSLIKLMTNTEVSLEFPMEQDKKIRPVDVHKKLLSILNLLATQHGIKTDEQDIKNGQIQPIDVLKLSVSFCDMIQLKAGREMLDKQLIIKYNEWKKNREIVPSDVLYLIDHFGKLLGRTARRKK